MMEKLNLYCKTCNYELTAEELTLVDIEEVSFKMETQLLPEGKYGTFNHINWSDGQANESDFVVNKMSIELKGHKDGSRFIGCCGAAEDNLPNQVCPRCSANIGVLVDDCSTPHYVRILFDRVSDRPIW